MPSPPGARPLTPATDGVDFATMPDREYSDRYVTLLRDRTNAEERRPMQKFNLNAETIVAASREQARPSYKLPETNLALAVTRPQGLGDVDSYMWDLAQLIEGRSACTAALPDWKNEQGPHFKLSKLLSWACRHSNMISDGNWINLRDLMRTHRRVMGTA